jgi:hypothetical protein
MKKTVTILFIYIISSVQYSFSQSWLSMASGLGNSSESIKAIAEDPVTHEIYAGGTFQSGSIKYIAKWNGTNWESVGTGVNGPVYALAFKNQELYVGGAFSTAGGLTVSNLAKWSGGVWSDVGGGFNDQVNCIYVSSSSGVVHAGGKFSLSGANPMNHVSKLVSGTWTQLGTGIGAVVNALAEYNGSLYAGSESLSGPVHKFDGSIWSVVSGLASGKVFALASFAGYLYAGGDFSSPTFAAAKYNGTSWGTIQTTFSSSDKIYALSPRFSTVLYIAGKFTNLGIPGKEASYIARINSPTTPIQSITTTSSTISSEVYAIGNQSGKVVAGGKFATPATNIAITSTTIGIDEVNKVVDSKFFPNPVRETATLIVTTSEKLNNAEIKVYDLQSRLIENIPSEKQSNGKTVEFSIDCTGLSRGVYYYQIIEDSINILSDQFIVE